MRHGPPTRAGRACPGPPRAATETGRRGDPRRGSVPPQEQVRPPRVVPLVGEIRREERVDIAARLERVLVQPQTRLVEGLAALPVIACLARGDEVLPRVPTAPVARHDVIEGQVARLPAAVLAGVPVAGKHLAP